MSHVITFDTLKFVRRLETAGFEPKKAEAITQAVGEVFEENLNGTLFTKADSRLMMLEIKNETSKLETRLILWVVGLLLAQNALIFGLLKLAH